MSIVMLNLCFKGLCRTANDHDLPPTCDSGYMCPSLIDRAIARHTRARSSAGRAPAWHAGGRRFDPDRVHHLFKKSLMNKVFLALAFCILLVGCAVYSEPLPTQQKEALTDKLINDQDFMGIFKHRHELAEIIPGGETHLTSAVEKYILSCCRDKNSAIKLLNENGFKVYPVKANYWGVNGYQQAFHAQRLSSPVNLIFETKYNVVIFINDNEVKKVKANYFPDFKSPKPHSPNYRPPRLINP